MLIDPQLLAEQIKAGKRRALSKAITLVESTRRDHRAAAVELLQLLAPSAGGAIRIGISGVPGVGKSTFIEALGNYVIGKGHRLAVLAVDPSSSLSGGSIMGDKTRMEELSRQVDAFIRPSPAGSTLGASHAVHGRPCCYAKQRGLMSFLSKPWALGSRKPRWPI